MSQVLRAADLHLFCRIDPIVTSREKQHLGHAGGAGGEGGEGGGGGGGRG